MEVILPANFFGIPPELAPTWCNCLETFLLDCPYTLWNNHICVCMGSESSFCFPWIIDALAAPLLECQVCVHPDPQSACHQVVDLYEPISNSDLCYQLWQEVILGATAVRKSATSVVVVSKCSPYLLTHFALLICISQISRQPDWQRAQGVHSRGRPQTMAIRLLRHTLWPIWSPLRWWSQRKWVTLVNPVEPLQSPGVFPQHCPCISSEMSFLRERSPPIVYGPHTGALPAINLLPSLWTCEKRQPECPWEGCLLCGQLSRLHELCQPRWPRYWWLTIHPCFRTVDHQVALIFEPHVKAALH